MQARYSCTTHLSEGVGMAIVHHVEATVQVNPNRSEICEEGATDCSL